MAGIVTEGAEMIEEEEDEEVKDAGSIAAAQRVEHYETVSEFWNGIMRSRGETQWRDLVNKYPGLYRYFGVWWTAG